MERSNFSTSILDGISLAIVIIDLDGGIKYVNRAMLKMFGYSHEEVVGKKVEFLVPENLHEKHIGNRLLYLKKMESRPMGEGISLKAQGHNGRLFPVEIGLDSVKINGEKSIIASIVDISRRKELESKLEISEERWQFALEGSDQGVWDWNVKTGEVFFSKQWKAMLGFEEEEIADNLDEWKKRVHPEDIDSCFADIKDHFERKVPIYTNEHRMLCKKGKYKWILDRGKLMSRTLKGEPLRMVGTHTDITDRKKSEEILRNAAQKDHLTGLYNRRTFQDSFNYEMSRFGRTKRSFSILLCDIDHFKKINDTYGHDCGDMVLKEVAELLTDLLRKQDIVGRWGGEEFIILLPETSIKGGQNSADKIRKSIAAKPFDYDQNTFSVTMSFGVAECNSECSLEDLVQSADKRLYSAKQQGRNRVVAEDVE